jgi:hypothetical protein
MTTPRCPYCNAQGLDVLRVELTLSFQVVHCGQCGAIHGILPLAAAPTEAPKYPQREVKTTLAQPPKQAPERPQAKISPPAPAPPVEPLAKTQERLPVKPAKKPLTKDQIGLMALSKGFYGMAFDPPLCPKCNIDMVEDKVPEGHKEAGQAYWKCPNFQTCKQWLPIRD